MSAADELVHIIKITLYSILLNSAMFSVCVFIVFMSRYRKDFKIISNIYSIIFLINGLWKAKKLI